MQSDEERLEAIRQTQKEMHSFDHINTRELLKESWDGYWKSRKAFHAAINAIMKENHSFWELLRIDRRSSNTEHIKTCDNCQKLLGETIRQLSREYNEEKK